MWKQNVFCLRGTCVLERMYDFLCTYFQEGIAFLFSRWNNRSSEILANTHSITYLKSEWHDWAPGPGLSAAKSLQSSPTLCDPIDGSPPGPAVPGILQARTLEWVAISSSNAWKWKVKVKLLSRVRLLVTSWTAAHQAPPSMGFSRQEYWSGLPLPSPKYLSTDI